MRLDLAMNMKIGDVAYNAFMDKLVITSRFDRVNGDGTKIADIIFGTIDTRLRAESYMFDDLYFADLEGESDEEKSFVNWAKDNRDFFGSDEYENCNLLKQAYKQGYAMGFNSRLKTSYEEQMQK
jgi:hypothetical protein